MNINNQPKPFQTSVRPTNAETINAANLFAKKTTNAFGDRVSPSQALQKSMDNDKNGNEGSGGGNPINALWGVNRTNGESKNMVGNNMGQIGQITSTNSPYTNGNTVQRNFISVNGNSVQGKINVVN